MGGEDDAAGCTEGVAGGMVELDGGGVAVGTLGHDVCADCDVGGFLQIFNMRFLGMMCDGWVCCCLVLSSVAVAGDWRLEALQFTRTTFSFKRTLNGTEQRRQKRFTSKGDNRSLISQYL